MNTLPTPSPEAALAWDAAHLANENLTAQRTAEAQLIGAQALRQIEGVDLAPGSTGRLIDLAAEAEGKFEIAESMVPNLRQEGLTNDPIFNRDSTKESDSTSGERHAELREKLLATFDAGYDAYAANHSIKWTSGENRPIASKEEAMKELEEDLAVGVLDMIAADIARNKEADPRAAFDIGMLDNKDFTADEETEIAEALQSDLPYDGAPYVNEDYHNKKTAMKAVGNGKKLYFFYAPRHTNVPAGTVKENKQWLETQNAKGNGVATLRSPEDVEAMAHFRVLLNAGELNNPNTRFDNTYSRKIEDYKEKNGRPVDDCVASSFVYDDGQLDRSDSRVDFVYAGRALVVSKLSL